MGKWKWNPKTKGSGIITCIPQTGECPNKCPDCFFQSGRSYLEPLTENLPHIPSLIMTCGRVVRLNDGNDSNVDRERVEYFGRMYQNAFYNTAIPERLGEFPGPVVLTVNPGDATDTDWHKLKKPPPNLMFVRVRVNAWNRKTVTGKAVRYYTAIGVPVVLTFMAYYTEKIPPDWTECYEYKRRTTNSYWVLTERKRENIEVEHIRNPLVYSCGWKGTYSCQRCGNCVREYYNAKERLRDQAHDR